MDVGVGKTPAKTSLFIITVEGSFHVKRVWMEVGGGKECDGICGEELRPCVWTRGGRFQE